MIDSQHNELSAKLIATLVTALLEGDHRLQRAILRRLDHQHGIRLVFGNNLA